MEVILRVAPARSYNAGRAGLVDGGLCTRRAVMMWRFGFAGVVFFAAVVFLVIGLLVNRLPAVL